MEAQILLPNLQSPALSAEGMTDEARSDKVCVLLYASFRGSENTEWILVVLSPLYLATSTDLVQGLMSKQSS